MRHALMLAVTVAAIVALCQAVAIESVAAMSVGDEPSLSAESERQDLAI